MRARMGVCVFLTALVALVVLAQGECTREYRDGLVLTGDQRLVITEGTLCVHGNITLRDNARLIISDATLRMTDPRETVWEKQAYIELHADAGLEMRNVQLEVPGSGQGGVWVSAYGASRVEVDRLVPRGEAGLWIDVNGSARAVIRGTTLRELRLRESAAAEVAGSAVNWNINLQFSGTAHVVLEGLRRGVLSSWESPRDGGVLFRLSLQNTYVGGWSVEVFERARVDVRESALNRVIIGLGSLPDVIKDVLPGYYPAWALRGTSDTGGLGNLTLTSTTVDWWTLNVHGRRTPLTIRESQLGFLSVWDSVVVINAERLVLHAVAAGNSHVTVGGGDMTLLRGLELRSARLDLLGNMRVQYTASKLVWDASSAVRDYEVRVRDRAGQPARGVQLRLEDPSGAITTHTTDQDGVLRFTIRFDDTNHDKTWTLIVPGGAAPTRVPVTLLTSTPIQVLVP